MRQSSNKIGADVTELLELVLRQWKVIQHVREKFSCRILLAAPSHLTRVDRTGP
jgi:transposase